MRWIAAAALTALTTSLAFAQTATSPDPTSLLEGAHASEPPPGRPAPPQLPAQAARQLTALARSAMLRYLASHQPANAQPIPDELKAVNANGNGPASVADLPYDAVVTLRQDGQTVATAVGEGRGLASNVIVAALLAMRSPKLPDRITSDLLMRLTLELSILGKPTEIKGAHIAAVAAPGLIGLKLTRGVRDPGLRIEGADSLFRETFVLPSTAYVLGWDAARMRSQCLREMGSNPLASGLKGTWHAFATVHVVDDADGGTWQLYRGKILAPAEAIDAEALAAGADRAAAWLMRQVDKDGRLGPDDAPLAEQLYAAWVLARYGRLRNDANAGVAADAVVGYVATNYVRLSDDETTAYVVTPQPGEEPLATAMFLMASTELKPAAGGAKIQAALARYLMDQLATADVQARLDVFARALLALCRSGLPDQQPDASMLDALLAQAGAGEPGQPPQPASLHARDVSSLVWVVRAVLAAGPADAQRVGKLAVIVGAITDAQLLGHVPIDAYGGFCRYRAGVRQQPDTALTGAAVAMLSESTTALGRDQRAIEQMRRELAGPINDAKRFCHRMIYRSEEAYFVPADQRAAWSGAVRDRPEAAATSIPAAAAALEAMIAE
jgi:hypothetical protein